MINRSNEIFTRVENAFVKVIKDDVESGSGVAVYGEYILTAAHCTNYTLMSKFFVGKHFGQIIENQEKKIFVSPVAIEPICDIALLGEPRWDGDEGLDYLLWHGELNPVPICFEDYELNTDFRVYIYNHKREWIQGIAKANLKKLFIEFHKPIESGTSGSPIINERGEIVGIFSYSTTGTNNGYAPRVDQTLPVWLCDLIKEAQAK